MALRPDPSLGMAYSGRKPAKPPRQRMAYAGIRRCRLPRTRAQYHSPGITQQTRATGSIPSARDLAGMTSADCREHALQPGGVGLEGVVPRRVQDQGLAALLAGAHGSSGRSARIFWPERTARCSSCLRLLLGFAPGSALMLLRNPFSE